MNPLQKIVLALLAGVLVVAGAGRALLGGDDEPAAPKSEFVGSSEFIDLGTPEQEPEPQPGQAIEDLLPYFTEASFFGLIGFALGYTSRKVVKLGLILLTLIFAAIQGLHMAGVIENVDWGKAIELVNHWILNLKEDQSVTEWLTDKVPSAGALLAGYFIGFKQG
ncbi:MAG: FUN14 domain-containing protein [Planctomycetota bacterium]|jgi:uncharacterized membrane protein (Fun14 family)